MAPSIGRAPAVARNQTGHCRSQTGQSEKSNSCKLLRVLRVFGGSGLGQIGRQYRSGTDDMRLRCHQATQKAFDLGPERRAPGHRCFLVVPQGQNQHASVASVYQDVALVARLTGMEYLELVQLLFTLSE